MNIRFVICEMLIKFSVEIPKKYRSEYLYFQGLNLINNTFKPFKFLNGFLNKIRL